MRKLTVVLLAVILSGCSATSALTGLIGSKPEVSAQVGAENTKQTVGLNNKVDTSSETSNDLRNSSVGAVDTSSKKSVKTSSISADTISADKVEIRNSDGAIGAIAIAAVLIIIMISMFWFFIGMKYQSRKAEKAL